MCAYGASILPLNYRTTMEVRAGLEPATIHWSSLLSHRKTAIILSL